MKEQTRLREDRPRRSTRAKDSMRAASASQRSCHLPSFFLGASCCLPLLLWQWFGGMLLVSDQSLQAMHTAMTHVEDGSSTPVSATNGTCQSIPLTPLQHCIKYTQRKTDHLQIEKQVLTLPDLDDPPSFAFVMGSNTELQKAESLYGFNNYQIAFEGGVTNLWIQILRHHLSQQQQQNLLVLDGGMNTGFYTTLTAHMGVPVHAFDLQRDCFDVVQKILESNTPQMMQHAHLYNMGLSNEPSIMTATEGCSPSYNLMDQKALLQSTLPGGNSKIHQVPVVSIDLFLDQLPQTTDESIIPIVKLDIEGAETNALKGFVRHLPACHNIILEFSEKFTSRFTRPVNAYRQFHRLQREGFEAYMLFAYSIPADKRRDAGYLQGTGLAPVDKHPITRAPVPDDFRIVWRVTNWADLNKKACRVACNLWFHRVHD